MLRLYKDAANLCTLLGLFAGFAALLMLVEGWMTAALFFILLGALADVFDGPFARASRNRPERAGPFGQELDTLADVCHSVLAPALWVTLAHGGGVVGVSCGLALCLAGATRLAYFTAVKPEKPGCFIGVPVTYVPLALGLLELASLASLLSEHVWIVFTAVMVGAQIGRFHFPKLTGTKFWVFAAVVAVLVLETGGRALREVFQ